MNGIYDCGCIMCVHGTDFHVRNGIQALDYAETMYFAVRERSSSKKLSKTAKYIECCHDCFNIVCLF